MDAYEEIDIILAWINETYKTSHLIQVVKADYLIMFVGKYAVRIDITVDGVHVWLTRPGEISSFKWTDPKLFDKMKEFINGA